MTSIPGILQRYKVDPGRRFPVLLAGDTDAERAVSMCFRFGFLRKSLDLGYGTSVQSLFSL
jgi:hypothetical protein